MAARYVAAKERGESVAWASHAKSVRVDKTGKVAGPVLSAGPLIMHTESRRRGR